MAGNIEKLKKLFKDGFKVSVLVNPIMADPNTAFFRVVLKKNDDKEELIFTGKDADLAKRICDNY